MLETLCVPCQGLQQGRFFCSSPDASAVRLHKELLFAIKALMHLFAFLGLALNR